MFIQKNFTNFLHTGAFKEAEIDEVVDILTWNGVCEKNEELIFNAAIRWLEFKQENRRQFAERFDCLLQARRQGVATTIIAIFKNFLNEYNCNPRGQEEKEDERRKKKEGEKIFPPCGAYRHRRHRHHMFSIIIEKMRIF